MEENTLKKFRVKCTLINLKTGQEKMCPEVIIEGDNGNDAVCRFRNDLQKEGEYKLADDYSYFEIVKVA